MNVQWEGGGGSLRSIGKSRAENDCGDDAFCTWTGHELELYNAPWSRCAAACWVAA